MTENPIQTATQVTQPNLVIRGAPAGADIAPGSNLSGNYAYNAKSEPAVISTQNGKTILDKAVLTHQSDMASLGATQTAQTNNQNNNPAPKISDATAQAIKAQGGVTADEAKASGISTDILTQNYSYDTNSGYFVPKDDSTKAAQGVTDRYAADTKAINDAFSGMIGGMDAATTGLIQSITSIYNSRMAAQTEVNNHQQAATNTMNLREGTSRYAGGVANSILTAEENYGLEKINAIAAEMSGKIAQANSDLQAKKYTAFIDNRNEIDKLTAERNSTLQKLHDEAIAQAKDQRDFLYKQKQDKITNDLNAKIHDDTVSYQDKQLLISKSQLSETRRHNMAQEAHDIETAKIDSAYKKAQIAKMYADMDTGDITAANDWVKNIKSGQAKLSDVPKNLKNAVATGLANGSNSQTEMLATTKKSLDELNAMVKDNKGFTGAVGMKGPSSLFGLKGHPFAGTDAYNFDAKLKQTMNDVVLPNLTLLHGLGRVTDREFQALQSAVTSLNPDLGQEEFKTELKNITDRVDTKIAELKADDQRQNVQKAVTAGYSPDDIITEYEKDPEMAKKIKAAHDLNYSNKEIVDALLAK